MKPKKTNFFRKPKFHSNVGPFRKCEKVVLIFGSRSLEDYDLFKKKMDYYTKNFIKVRVFHGGCKSGADDYAAWWASKNWYAQVIFHADWERDGKQAGIIRNEEMAMHVAKFNGVAVGFWDGKSPGTADMIRRCRKHGIKLKIVRF